MFALVKIVAAVLAGVFLGLVITIRTLDTGAHTIVAGPWQGAPRNGTFDVDPYTLASDERSGVLPLGVAEGLSFIARTDSDGRALHARAATTSSRSPMPQARFWSLSLLDPAGFPVADPAGRYGFTSAEILRQIDAPVAITDLARGAQRQLAADRPRTHVTSSCCGCIDSCSQHYGHCVRVG